MLETKTLPDQNQSYWQLALIQSAAFGMPVLSFGAMLGRELGAGTALIAICLGNILLWLISLRIIGMTVKSRENAIENLAEYIVIGRWIAGITLFIAFLLWYPLQIKSDIAELKQIASTFSRVGEAFEVRAGTFIGLIIALLAIGGIRLIKYVNIICFPFLLLFIVYAVLNNTSIPSISLDLNTEALRTALPLKLLKAIFATIAITLVTIINLPTFFRHRRSQNDAIFALPIFILFTTVTECLAVFVINGDSGELFTQYLNTSRTNAIGLSIFLILSVICANLVNIYFASAVWEVLIPWVSRAKELALIGVLGTATFIFFQSEVLMAYAEALFTTFIAILGLVAINGYGAQQITGHRERGWELVVNTIYWLVGCIFVIIILDINTQFSVVAFVIGSSISAFLLWSTLFIEEICWGIKKLILNK